MATITIPLLPLRDILVFPHTVVPLFVGRLKSMSCLEAALVGTKEVLLCGQKHAMTTDPISADIYPIGTVAKILQHLKMPDGTVKVLVEGRYRARIVDFLETADYFLVKAEKLVDFSYPDLEMEALLRNVKIAFEEYMKVKKSVHPEILSTLSGIKNACQFSDSIIAHIPNLKHDDKQRLLEELDPKVRLESICTHLQSEIEISRVEKKIRARVKKQVEKTQKEFYLNEQMAAIQKELGDKDEKTEIYEMEQLAKKKKLSDEARDKVTKEIKKLKMMSPTSAESAVVRNYIDTILSLPWKEYTEEKKDINFSAEVLDRDHFGLEKVKDRILEYLTMCTLAEDMKGPILCLSGPPGVGKCLGKGTPVLMFDGTVKPVEAITAGEKVMGPDSYPRKVLSTAVGRGQLYTVTPVKGSPWVCNDVHVLTLVNCDTGNLIDIPLNEYLVKSDNFKSCHKLVRTGVQWEGHETSVDPYLFGQEIGENIPQQYLVNSLAFRLQLLAGILDTHGHKAPDGYDLVTKYFGIRDDILFLARSVGLAAYASRSFDSWHIRISGECEMIPCRIESKKFGPRKKTQEVLHTGFSIEPIGEGDYFGFELDGDGRFLLGDFTVTHNTSLAKSIAEATGRKFVRISLGGVRDEAEIRGHRRTYIGAMPGKIINAIRKAGSSNPLILLDEIDKLTQDFRGDPTAALLEVLDPEQNGTFTDHYMDMEYDLSKVLFLATANTLHTISRPLLDRMEVISLSGYTEKEKVAIAEQYLISKQVKVNGLTGTGITVESSAVEELVRYYTRESGVRNLEREIGSLLRKCARKHLEKGKNKEKFVEKLDAKAVNKYLGPRKYRIGVQNEDHEVGLCTGLAWTEVGGDLLVTEVTILPGKGKLTCTGKLGDVMQESAQAALSYVRSRAKQLKLEDDFYQKIDIHIHVPEGAIPKDGPSAGIAMATALTSALTNKAISKDVAMTGEITLRGRVLPIGGLKEKIIAAHRGGIKKVLIPIENKKDIEDLPKAVLKEVKIVCVSHMDEVLKQALVK